MLPSDGGAQCIVSFHHIYMKALNISALNDHIFMSFVFLSLRLIEVRFSVYTLT